LNVISSTTRNTSVDEIAERYRLNYAIAHRSVLNFSVTFTYLTSET